MIQVGDLHYNGWDFPEAVHSTVRIQPVMDSSGRYTKHVLYTLQVEMVLYPGVDQDTPTTLFDETLDSADGVDDGTYTGMDQLRLVLLEDGKDLRFTGKGLGYDFDISTGNNEDVAHGPHVKDLVWEPIGVNKAVRVVWTCEVAIANCPVSSGKYRIMEFTTESSYSFNERGLATRTVRGKVVIPNRLVGNVPARWVDDLRQSVNVPVPLAFQRISQRWTPSSDGTTLEFAITDRQYESRIPLHRGIVEHDVNHRVDSVGKIVGIAFKVTVSGRFKVSPCSTKLMAWSAFLWFLKSRRDAALTFAQYTDKNGKTYDNIAIPVQLSIDDSTTNQDISFTVAWLVYCRPSDVLNAAGVLAKVQGSSWGEHASSMRQTWQNSGISGLRSLKRNVIKPCDGGGALYVNDTPPQLCPQDHGRLFLVDECQETWIKFAPYCSLTTGHQAVTLYPTGGEKTYSPVAGPEYPSADSGGRRAVVTHKRGEPRYRVVFRGKAAKMGGPPIRRPKLVSFGGVDKLTPIGEGTWHTYPVKKVGDCDLHTVFWLQEYELEGTPVNEDDFVCNPNLRIP